jgi:hypothetical protein
MRRRLEAAATFESDGCDIIESSHRPGTTLNGTYMTASRAVWILANGVPPDGLWVLHTCHNDRCVNIRHLYLGTAADNMRDMAAAGRGMIGERARNGRLTAPQVLAIRAAHAAGQTMSSLAREYGVRLYSIQMIVHRTSWRHI